MHERTAAARRLELGHGIASGLPDPPEVELEPEQLRVDLPEKIEKRRPAGERLGLARVVVEAETKPGVAGGARRGLDPVDNRTRLREPGGIDPADRDPVGAEHGRLLGELLEPGLQRVEPRVAPGGHERASSSHARTCAGSCPCNWKSSTPS